MFSRKLNALKFGQASTFNVHDDSQFQHLVIWLEDQKIRHYKMENRAGLRDSLSPQWTKAFGQYLQDLHCPYNMNDDKIAVMDWLLGHAVRLDYADNIDSLKTLSAEKISQQRKSNATPVVSANPLDKLDFQSDEFKKGVQDLARILKIPQHPDHLIMLKAICQLVSQRLSVTAVKKASVEKRKPAEGVLAALQDYELGFRTHDAMLDDACKILRLLHVHKMRDLQTNINETIVAVQNLTANPKTDDKLGKVGFG